jgi:hypothetical protein
VTLDELEALAAKATPGPWSVCTDAAGDTFIASLSDTAETVCEFGAGYDDEQQAGLEANAALIVYLCNAVPTILALKAERDMLREALAVIAYEEPDKPWLIAHNALKQTAFALKGPSHD